MIINRKLVSSCLLLSLISILLPTRVCSETEEERIAERARRGYEWPVTEWVPNTPGWKSLYEHRVRQAEELSDKQDRFEAFVQTLTSGLIQKNFTKHGFGLARAPEDLMQALREGIEDGLEKGPRLEEHYDAIAGLRPWFIDRPDLMTRVLKELQHYPEEWAGMELTPETAYGFRLYRNQSNLYMHVDRPKTHVISFILHIASSEDSEPWPILIEDFDGVTHEVVLTSGDILFYESSKCFHGRPHKFNGSWYSSVFVHYYPKYGYQENYDERERVYAIPNHWVDEPTTHHEIEVVMHGTTYEEPDCPNGWCATKHSKKWSGPGEDGFVIAPNGDRVPFNPKDPACDDYDKGCDEWSATGECEKNPTFMLIHCKKSCKVCTPGISSDEL